MLERLKNQVGTNFKRVREEYAAWKKGMAQTFARFEYGTWNLKEKENYPHLAMAVVVDTVRLMPRTVSYTLVVFGFTLLVVYLA